MGIFASLTKCEGILEDQSLLSRDIMDEAMLKREEQGLGCSQCSILDNGFRDKWEYSGKQSKFILKKF